MALTRTPSGPIAFAIWRTFASRTLCQTHNVVIQDSALSAKGRKGSAGQNRIQHGQAAFCHCNEAVELMSWAILEAFTSNGVNIVTIQLIAGCKTNRVYETVRISAKLSPVQRTWVSMLVSSATSLQSDVRSELSGKFFFYAAFQFGVVLVGECQVQLLRGASPERYRRRWTVCWQHRLPECAYRKENP